MTYAFQTRYPSGKKNKDENAAGYWRIIWAGSGGTQHRGPCNGYQIPLKTAKKEKGISNGE
jgi:hypothetical protein